MSVSDMVQRLAALGATAEMIAVAVEALCTEQQKDADRRAKRTEQKRRERAVSRDEEATVVRPPKRPPTPPKNTPLTPSETSSPQDASAEKPADASPALSLKDQLWLEGKPLLVGMGLAEAKAGSMIGRWLRDTEGDAGRILWAIEEARRTATGDPIPYVTRLLSNSPVAQRGRSKAPAPKDGITSLLRELEGRTSHERHRHDGATGREGAVAANGAAHLPYPQRGGMEGGQVLDLQAVRSDRR